MWKQCRTCNGSGWVGPRTDLGRPLGIRGGGPCRKCQGKGGFDDGWQEKSCSGCGSTIRYRADWSNIPQYCSSCRNRDLFKSCANPHCGGQVRYKVFWDNVPDFCQCKGWYEKRCENPRCSTSIRVHSRWDNPPKYCEVCRQDQFKPCATRGCSEQVRFRVYWDNPPEYCETCKKLGGRHRDPWKDPRNRVEEWIAQSTGQINQKIVSGPDAGIHRFYNPKQRRSGQTGTERF